MSQVKLKRNLRRPEQGYWKVSHVGGLRLLGRDDLGSRAIVLHSADYHYYLRVMYGDEVGTVADEEPIASIDPSDFCLLDSRSISDGGEAAVTS
jgi:hypothetical protein